MKKRECLAVIVPLALVAWLSTGCYESYSPPDSHSHDTLVDDILPDRPPDYYPDYPPPDVWPDYPPDTVPPDTPGSCQTITPTVISVEISNEGCYDPDAPYVTAIVTLASPYCGEAVNWWQDLVWTSDTSYELIPYLYMCSDTWEYCDPGAVTTLYTDIYLPAPEGSYQLVVQGMAYEIGCWTGVCTDQSCYIESVLPSDYRPYRLFGSVENIDFVISYTTGACGCSEFYPLTLVNTGTGMEDNYYYSPLTATICQDRCCWDCDCIDIGESRQSLPSRGGPATFEAVLDGSTRDVRGFVADPMANPMSECGTFPATITAATPTAAYYDLGQPVDVDVTIAYESPTPGSCCEVHSEVAFDAEGYSGGVYLFAFRGECMACYDDSCPPFDTRRLHISAFALTLGEHVIYDSVTGSVLGRFYITGED
jgi:hypothetical protein